MPLFRTGRDRYTKYQLKYNPDVVRQRFADVQAEALARAQEGLILHSTIDNLVGPILDAYGVTGPDRAKYLGFAKKLAKHVLRQKGEAGKKIATALKQYWVTAFGADPAILDEIINVVVGWAVQY